MKNVRVSYTVNLAEVPQEVDNQVKVLKQRCQTLTAMAKTISFRDNAKASLQIIQAFKARLQDVETVLLDCENLGHGLVDLEARLATVASSESESSAERSQNLQELQEGVSKLIPEQATEDVN